MTQLWRIQYIYKHRYKYKWRYKYRYKYKYNYKWNKKLLNSLQNSWEMTQLWLSIVWNVNEISWTQMTKVEWIILTPYEHSNRIYETTFTWPYCRIACTQSIADDFKELPKVCWTFNNPDAQLTYSPLVWSLYEQINPI